jgi:hypothetical protein
MSPKLPKGAKVGIAMTATGSIGIAHINLARHSRHFLRMGLLTVSAVKYASASDLAVARFAKVVDLSK